MDVVKLDAHGRRVWAYPAACVLYQTGQACCLEAYFQRPDYDLGFVVLAHGDRFVEYFYADRWYNLFAVYAGQTAVLKGWYANICRPAQWTADQVTYEDLALDLWIWPDGQTLLLDEEEFEALQLPPAERERAMQAADYLQQLASQGSLPR